MAHPRVVKIGTGPAVYVGRPTPLGNPFILGVHGDREKVVALYKEWFEDKIKDEALPSKVIKNCANKNLSCYCAPKLCHAEIIVEWLEGRGL